MSKQRGRRSASSAGVSGSKKELQICRQAFEAISLAFATLNDETWLDVEVVGVYPAPDASRLSISVRVPRATDAERLLERLARIDGYLRSEVCSAIARKRAPTLAFRVMSSVDE